MRQSTNVGGGGSWKGRGLPRVSRGHTPIITQIARNLVRGRGLCYPGPDQNEATCICGSLKPTKFVLRFLFLPAFHFSSRVGYSLSCLTTDLHLPTKDFFNGLGKLGNLDRSDALDQLCHIWQRTCPTFAQRGHFWWQWSGTVTHFGQLVPGQSPNQATMPD